MTETTYYGMEINNHLHIASFETSPSASDFLLGVGINALWVNPQDVFICEIPNADKMTLADQLDYYQAAKLEGAEDEKEESIV